MTIHALLSDLPLSLYFGVIVDDARGNGASYEDALDYEEVGVVAGEERRRRGGALDSSVRAEGGGGAFGVSKGYGGNGGKGNGGGGGREGEVGAVGGRVEMGGADDIGEVCRDEEFEGNGEGGRGGGTSPQRGVRPGKKETSRQRKSEAIQVGRPERMIV